MPAEEIDRLLQPFQRLAADRLGHGEGLGLGLSIVAAISSAHDAAIDVRPGAHGGLEISVRFARATTGDRDVTVPGDPVPVGVGVVET